MNHLFISHYIALILKGNSKWLQITSAGVFIILPLIYLETFINFITGKQITLSELLVLVLLIYFLMNLAYAIFNKTAVEKRESTANLVISNIKTSPKTQSEIKQAETTTILSFKNYSKDRPIKLQPKTNVNIKKSENTSTFSEFKTPPPPLEVNFESATEFTHDSPEIPINEYSGELNENFDSEQSEMKSLSPPSQEADMFDKTNKKKIL